MQPYKDIAEIATRYYEYTGDCPIAEQIAKRVLTIPSHHALKETEVKRIAECLNSGWNENLECLPRY